MFHCPAEAFYYTIYLLLVVDVSYVYLTRSACRVPKQNTRNIYHKWMINVVNLSQPNLVTNLNGLPLCILQELAYRRPSVQKATDWQNQLSKSVSISKSQNNTYTTNGGVNGVSHAGDVEGDDGLAAAKVGLGAVIVLGGIYAARKLLKR